MNQFNRAWNFYAKNWKFFIVLAAPIMMLEIAMASMITPIQNVTQPEDILEFFNENIAFLGSVSLLGVVLSMAFMGALFVSYASIESENEIEPLNALFLGIRKFFPLLGAYLIASVGVFFGILLLILPAFYVAARLCIFPAFIMLEDKGAI
jgi:uncharacterized membrane protein